MIHGLDGNLLRALSGFGHLDDDRAQAAIAWASAAITGEGMERWYRSGTCGPWSACAANARRRGPDRSAIERGGRSPWP